MNTGLGKETGMRKAMLSSVSQIVTIKRIGITYYARFYTCSSNCMVNHD
jgi:hypothetical protein